MTTLVQPLTDHEHLKAVYRNIGEGRVILGRGDVRKRSRNIQTELKLLHSFAMIEHHVSYLVNKILPDLSAIEAKEVLEKLLLESSKIEYEE
jgi:hypothetical protein